MSVQVEAGRLDHTQVMFCGFMCISQEVYVGSQTPDSRHYRRGGHVCGGVGGGVTRGGWVGGEGVMYFNV